MRKFLGGVFLVFNVVLIATPSQAKQIKENSKVPYSRVEGTDSSTLKNYNFSLNPLWALLGSLDAEFDFGTSEDSSLGVFGSFMSYRINDNHYTSLGLGLRYNHYLGHLRFTSGWYLSPYAQVVPRFLNQEKSTSIEGGAVIGYQWVFDSGFNIMLGLGISAGSTKNVVFSSSSSFWVLPTGEFRLGYAW